MSWHRGAVRRAARCAVRARCAPRRRAAADAPPRIVVGAKKFTEGADPRRADGAGARDADRRDRRAPLQSRRHAGLLRRPAHAARSTCTPSTPAPGCATSSATPRRRRRAAAVFAQVSAAFRERFELIWLAPFGFNNTYVLMMRPRPRRGARHRARSSDLAAPSAALRHVARVSAARPTACPACARRTSSTRRSTVGIEHDLAYQALGDGAIDVVRRLLDRRQDRRASTCCRCATTARSSRRTKPRRWRAPTSSRACPLAEPALRLLAGRIDDATMRRLNYAVEGERRSSRRGRRRVPRASSA